jgi:hypothetical protein
VHKIFGPFHDVINGFDCNYSNDSRKHDDMWLGGTVMRGALISYLPVNET